MPDNTFESWKPDSFARDARYQRTIRTFLEGKIAGDVLDVGCGSRIFYGLGGATSWTGLDISERMLSGIHFHDEVADKRILRGDVLGMEFAGESFDTVVAFFLLHHLGRDSAAESRGRVQRAFSGVHRVLRPGGRFIVGENCRGPLEAPYHWLFPLAFPMGRRLARTDLPFFWKARHYERFGEEAGFASPPMYVHVPVVEWIYNPILGFSVPPVLSHDLIQKMTIFEFLKPA